METILSALKKLDQLYSDLENQVFGDTLWRDGNDTAALSEPVICNQHLIVRLKEADDRLADFVRQWPDRRTRISAEDRDRIAALAETVRSKASRLLTGCEDRASQLRTGMLRLEHALGQIRQGARYMQSSKAAAVNYS